MLEGDITFDTLTLHAGDYHVAHRGSPHPEGNHEGRLPAADVYGGVTAGEIS